MKPFQALEVGSACGGAFSRCRLCLRLEDRQHDARVLDLVHRFRKNRERKRVDVRGVNAEMLVAMKLVGNMRGRTGFEERRFKTMPQ